MFFPTTDDRIKRIENRIDSLEGGMKKILLDINESLITITDVISRLQKENKEMKDEKKLKRDKEKIEAAQKTIEREIKDIAPGLDVKESVKPLKNIITENYSFIQNVAREGLQPNPRDLLRLLEREGEMGCRDAAAKLKVHELQIEKWSNALKQEKLIIITEKNGRKYLSSNKKLQEAG